jgi:formylmethanofuran dehydrogenase subunit C
MKIEYLADKIRRTASRLAHIIKERKIDSAFCSAEDKKRIKKMLLASFNNTAIKSYPLDKSYEDALALIPEIYYSLDDVVDLIKDQQENNIFHCFGSAGIYLSALLNRVIKDSDVIRIDIKPAEGNSEKRLLMNLGMYLPRGKLIFNGDAVIGAIGYGMNGGEIIVKGNCKGEPAQSMKRGKITIEGDILDDHFRDTYGVAYGMEGGKLIVKGNVKIFERTGNWTMKPPEPWVLGGIGFNMKGGEVIIYGNAKDVGYKMQDGDITIKGSIEHEHSNAGVEMSGGTIIIEGSVKSVGWKMKGGIIKANRVGENEGRSNVFVSYGSIGSEMRGGDIIVVEDSVGEVGHEMRGGAIKIGKNLKTRNIGWSMSDGTIEIEGNVIGEAEIGLFMKGGSIRIEGSADNSKIGHLMEGGRIDINGFMPPDSSFKFMEKPARKGGAVYNKGLKIESNIRSKIRKWVKKLEIFD